MKHQNGFSLIELLIVVSIIGLMMTVTLPVSMSMYARYKASLKAQEVMIAVADLRRESFLYSEKKILSSVNNTMMINGEEKNFSDIRIRIGAPIQFYKNGTTSGGSISLLVGEYVFVINIKAPLGDMNLDGGARAA